MNGFSAVAAEQRLLGVALALLAIRLDAVHALLREEPGRARQQLDRLQQVARHQRDVDVELEVPVHAADRDRGVVADHLRRDLRDDLGDDRVDLAGHDRRALLQLGQEELGEPGARAGAQEAEVVRDLRQGDGDDLERAGGLDEAVAGGLRLEVVDGRGDRQARLAGEELAHAGGELGVRVEPRADGGAAERDLAEPRHRVLDARDPLAHLRRVAGELLAERDGHRVHPVGAART